MEQDPKQFVKDASTGMDYVLVVMSCLCRTVQIFSRIPGSTGPWYLGPYLLGGLIIQSWYFVVNLQATGQADWIPFGFVVGISLLWFGVHGVIGTYLRTRGERTHSHDPGTPVLHHLFASWSEPAALLGSDLSMSMAVSLFFYLCRSPILGGWFAAMCAWLILMHLYCHVRDARRMQAWEDAAELKPRFGQNEQKGETEDESKSHSSGTC